MSSKPKAAVSACLTGCRCRYDGTDNYDPKLLGRLEGYEIVPFCPEDFCFGSPRPTMDLIETPEGVKALSNLTGADLTPPIRDYARSFFDTHRPFSLFVGKDRSPSCGVRSARLYDRNKRLIDSEAEGIMAAEARRRGVLCYDAEELIALPPGAFRSE